MRREYGMPRHGLHKNFEMTSTLTSRRMRSRLWSDPNQTARRSRNHLEFFKIFMQTVTELSTLSMGQSISVPILSSYLNVVWRQALVLVFMNLHVYDKNSIVPHVPSNFFCFHNLSAYLYQWLPFSPLTRERCEAYIFCLWIYLVILYCVPSRVWTVPSLCSWKFWKIRKDFASEARSNPTARRHRNPFEFFKLFMNIGTELSTLSMGHSIQTFSHFWPDHCFPGPLPPLPRSSLNDFCA